MELLGFDVPVVGAVCAAFILWQLVKYAFFGFDVFEKQGIPTVRPVYPIVGNLWNVWKIDARTQLLEDTKKYGKIYGFFYGKTPVYVISDPDLIKAITVKESDNFVDRPRFIPEREKYIRKMMSNLRGQEWKDVRSAVSPVFSSGKIKRMVVLMEDCCQSLLKVAKKRASEGKGVVDMKELYGVYTLDVIASCAFGTKIDNLDDPDNPFISKSRKAFNISNGDTPILMLILMYPWLIQWGLRFFPVDAMEFYAKLTMDIIRNRRKENTKRGDVLDIMIEVCDEEQKALKVDPNRKQIMDEETVVAQSTIFFLAGFDTTGTLLTMASYHLALNPDCQEKLYNEVSAVAAKHGGRVTYDMTADCSYLDQVLNESLRLNPPAIQVQRLCTTSCQIGKISFKKGDIVAFPVYAMHHSEENFPNPEKFDPDRWSLENKTKIKPQTFMPFGNGPRNCIGMRFAQEEAKLGLASMVLKYKFLRCPETPVPYKSLVNLFLIQPINLVLKLEPRS